MSTLNMLQRAAAKVFRLEYDAAKSGSRRRQPPRAMKSADSMQTTGQRKQLVSGSRDAQRNFAICAWAVRKHLDYVSSVQFRPRTQDAGFNADLAEFFRVWSRPHNCDVARRHGFNQLIRHWEERRTADGDVGILKLANGQLQTIEGDRIRADAAQADDSLVHGVRISSTGAAQAYLINKRTKSGGFELEREVQARRMWLFGYFDRIDQVRGVSPLAPAINTLQDVYESFGYALSKAKISQLFGLVFYRDAIEPLEGPANDDDEADADYQVSFDAGNVPVLDLNPGDRAEFLENKTPATEFQEFTRMMVSVALKALDLPYSFFDESHTNYSGARQALLQYEQSAANKRAQLVELLNSIMAWRVAMAVRDRDLIVPKGLQVRWEWVPNGVPWIDPKKETEADILAINAGLASRTQLVKQRFGQDWLDVVDELEAERREMEQRGLATALPAVSPDGADQDE